MSSAKRVYVYGIALASLVMVVWGVSDLVHLLLEWAVRLWLAVPTTWDSSDVTERLSRALATTAIGLPVWALHWRWAQAAAYGRGRVDVAEISAMSRKLYLYVVLFVGALNLALALHQLLNDVLDLAFGRAPSDWMSDRLLLPIAVMLTRTPIWLYHAGVAARDRANGGEVGSGVTIRRWCIYTLALIGLLLWVFTANELVQTIVDYAAHQAGIRPTGGDRWARDLTEPLPRLVPGLVLWLVAWSWSSRLATAEAGPSSDRASTLRRVYLYGVLFFSVSLTIWNVAQLFHALIRSIFIAPESDPARLVELVRELVVPIVVYGATWAYHARAVRHDAQQWPEQAQQSTIRWTYEYLVAFVGALTLAGGLTELLATLATAAAGVDSSGLSLRERLSSAVTPTVVGLGVWYLHWRRMQREASDPEARALISSGPRRAYLYLAVGISVLGLLAAGAFLVYQAIQIVLRQPLTDSVTRDVIQSVSAAIVAVAFLIYHSRVLRRDTERRGLRIAPQRVILAIARPRADADLGTIRDAFRSIVLPTTELDVVEVDEATVREILRRAGQDDRARPEASAASSPAPREQPIA